MIEKFITESIKHEEILIGYLWAFPKTYKNIRNHKISKTTFAPVNSKTSKYYALFSIGKSMFSSNIVNFDEMTIDGFLGVDSRAKVSKVYDNIGGHFFVDDLKNGITKDVDYNYHLNQILKYEALRNLYSKGLIDDDDAETIDKLCNANLESVRKYFKYQVTSAFKNVNQGNYEVIDLVDNNFLTETIKKVNDGTEIGVPLIGANLLNRQIKGFNRGRLHYLALESGGGKSSIARNFFVPSLISANENFIILINEEDKHTWATNLLITVANLKLKKFICKDNVTSGDLKENDEEILNEAKDWLINEFEGVAKLVVLKTYRFNDCLDIIEEYANYGCNYVIFDTFKPDSNKKSDQARWEQFSIMSQELYDLIKPENLNIGVLATLQLKIGSLKGDRYLTHDSIGKSKEVVEVADITMLGRRFFADEYPSGDFSNDDFSVEGNRDKNNSEIYVYKRVKEGNSWVQKRVEINPNKEYVIIFFGKNRNGTDLEQLVYEINFDRGLVKEVGFTKLRKS